MMRGIMTGGLSLEPEPQRTLKDLLTDNSRIQTTLLDESLAATTTTVGLGPAEVIAMAVRRLAYPRPCRLTSQELVDLLKMPTCFGDARHVVLDHLGRIHGRRFASHWEFVAFARQRGLPVDLTSPPRRPA